MDNNNNNNNTNEDPYSCELDGELLTEVVTSDEPYLDEMSETASEINDDDNVEEVFDEEDEVTGNNIEINDLSTFKFEGHTDSVYCVKV